MNLEDLLKKKENVSGHKLCSETLRVNKYEHSSFVLDLIAHICQKGKALDLDPIFKDLFDIQSKYEERSIKKGYEFKNADLHLLLWCCVLDFKEELLEHFSSNLVIAVGGGYSSGKSSFLNSITNIGETLPTGIEPVSVVNTFLNCLSGIPQMEVRGENLKGDLVALNTDVLSSIQHSSKSKVYIAAVLNKLIIDIPNSDLDGITFIDTPGYNNSDNLNLETKRTDKDTALIAFNKADVIFWCIDIDSNGGLTHKDLQILKQIKEKQIVIFLTKMDKKPHDEANKIIRKVKDDCVRELNGQVVDVIGYSSERKIWTSTINENLLDLIALLKSKADKHKNLGDRFVDRITSIITNEIGELNRKVNTLEEKRVSVINEKKIYFDRYLACKDWQKTDIDLFKKIMLSDYEHLLNVINQYKSLINLFKKNMPSAYDYLLEIPNKSKSFDMLNIEYNDISIRERAYSDVEKYTKEHYEIFKEIYEDKDEEHKELMSIIKSYLDVRSYLEDYLSALTQYSKQTYDRAEKELKETFRNSSPISAEYIKEDIFSAIRLDDMNKFLSCFLDGVDMNKCNNEGFSPLTWTIKYGNNEMFKFFLNHGVDLKKRDKNGKNPFEIAVKFHQKHICEAILKKDSSLITESQGLIELANNNIFTKWFSTIGN